MATLMQLKAPDEFWQRLDAWREQQDFVPKPSRPASVRWIVWTFLQKQERRAPRKSAKRRRAK
jgi:hypothetical protein